MKSIIKQSFSINLFVMRAFGLYPREEPSLLYKLQGYFMYTAFTIPISLLGIVNLLLGKDFDNYSVILIAQMTSQVVKLYPFVSNGDRIRRCILYFQSPFFAVFKDNQKKILEDCAHVCERNSKIYLIFVIGCNLYMTSKPFFGKKYSLPVDVWLPCDPSTGPEVYYPVYLLLVLGLGYTSMASATTDALIAGLACLAAAQFAILKDNLRNLSEYAEEENCDNEESMKSEIIGKRIKRCIRHHNAILRFVDGYEECFSSVIFSQFLGSILVICFCCLQLSRAVPFSFIFFSVMTLLITFLMELYLYCYYGTILFEESNTLTDAIYMGKWYEYDVKLRRDLIIMMERSKKPVIVTAGKVLDLSVETFTMVLRRSYSLLAVLKNR